MRKNKISSILQVVRFIIQILFFIILPGIYINAFAGIKQIYLGIINQSFSFTDDLPQLIEVIAVIPATIILGRFFCGWVCAFGTLGDMLYHISSKVFKVKFKVNEKLDRVLKYFKFVLLAFLIVVVWTFDLSIFEGANPWDAFGVIATFGKVPDISFAFTEFTIGILILLAIIIASFFIERFFCRYLCPLGAFFAITSKVRFFKINKSSQKCGACKNCSNNCPMGIPLNKYDIVDSGECIQCFKCISACPRENLTLKMGKKEVNTGVAAALVIVLMTGLYYVGTFTFTASDNSIMTSAESALKSSKNKIYVDGTYQGTGIGFRGAVTTVSVTVGNDTIKGIEVVSHGDDAPYFDRSYESVANQILSSQSTEVDVVSGATYSSKGIIDAVADALGKAKIVPEKTLSDAEQNLAKETKAPTGDSNYRDGTYEGSASGFKKGITNVSVVIESDKITDIKVISHGDDIPFFDKALSVIDKMLQTQSTEVDVVSEATYSSKGIINAVEDALNKARLE